MQIQKHSGFSLTSAPGSASWLAAGLTATTLVTLDLMPDARIITCGGVVPWVQKELKKLAAVPELELLLLLLMESLDTSLSATAAAGATTVALVIAIAMVIDESR
jgi:hypothetical protein